MNSTVREDGLKEQAKWIAYKGETADAGDSPHGGIYAAADHVCCRAQCGPLRSLRAHKSAVPGGTAGLYACWSYGLYAGWS